MHRDAVQIAAAPEPGRCTPMLQMCELRAKSGQSRIASRESRVKEPGHDEQVGGTTRHFFLKSSFFPRKKNVF